jgi:hypothetical protein
MKEMEREPELFHAIRTITTSGRFPRTLYGWKKERY